MPKFLPAQGWLTRIQQEAFSSSLPWRSQWKCTLTRAVFVGVDLFALGADDLGGLQAVDQRLGGLARAAVLGGGGDGFEARVEGGPAAGGGFVFVAGQLEMGGDDQVLLVLVGPRVAFECEGVAGADAAGVG